MVMLISGFSLFKHYCGDELISMSLLMLPHACCEGNCPFCKNESTTFEIEDDFFNRIPDLLEALKSIDLFCYSGFSLLEKTINTIEDERPSTYMVLLPREHIRELAKRQSFLI